jgi:hypothetical protein
MMMLGAASANKAAAPPALSKRRRDKALFSFPEMQFWSMWFFNILLLLLNKPAE